MKKLLKRTEDRLFQSFLLLFLCLFFLASPTYAQGGFAVKGVVVDKTGFPLPGTNVMEKELLTEPLPIWMVTSH